MNKQAELTRWTPKRLLSLLMALIMTLSLLPTAALAIGEGETHTFDAASMDISKKHHIADDRIVDGSSTLWNLEFKIDRKEVAKPGDTIGATVYAYLNPASDSTVAITEVAVTDNSNQSKWTHTADTNIMGYPEVGTDGCARFAISVTYKVNGTDTYTKSANVVIKNLWTGYNVTYTQGADETFTGVPAGNNAKTVAKNANNSDYTQEYTIPDGAKASKDGYTMAIPLKDGIFIVLIARSAF